MAQKKSPKKAAAPDPFVGAGGPDAELSTGAITERATGAQKKRPRSTPINRLNLATGGAAEIPGAPEDFAAGPGWNLGQIGMGSLPQVLSTLALSPSGTASQGPDGDDFKYLLKVLADSFKRDQGMEGGDAVLRAALTPDVEGGIDDAAGAFLKRREGDFSTSTDSSSLVDDLGFDFQGPSHLRPQGPTSVPGTGASRNFMEGAVSDALHQRGGSFEPGSIVPPNLRGPGGKSTGGMNDPNMLLMMIDELASQWLRKGGAR